MLSCCTCKITFEGSWLTFCCIVPESLANGTDFFSHSFSWFLQEGAAEWGEFLEDVVDFVVVEVI
jgi:large-conductance mechanosensitive channel